MDKLIDLMKRGCFFIHCRLIILLFFLISASSAMANSGDLFTKANNQYVEGLYFDAIENYYQLLEEGYRSSDVYFNLGNAYYRLGNVGKSILNYERALLFEPGSEEISHNLHLANERKADIINPVEGNFLERMWDFWKGLFYPQTWSILSLTLIWLAAFLAIIAIFFLRAFTPKFILLSAAFALGIFSVLFLYTSDVVYKEHYEQKYGILLNTNANLKSEPAGSGETLFRISEGTRFEVLRKVNNYAYVRLENQNSGWIKKEYFEEIF